MNRWVWIGLGATFVGLVYFLHEAEKDRLTRKRIITCHCGHPLRSHGHTCLVAGCNCPETYAEDK